MDLRGEPEHRNDPRPSCGPSATVCLPCFEVPELEGSVGRCGDRGLPIGRHRCRDLVRVWAPVPRLQPLTLTANSSRSLVQKMLSSPPARQKGQCTSSTLGSRSVDPRPAGLSSTRRRRTAAELGNPGHASPIRSMRRYGRRLRDVRKVIPDVAVRDARRLIDQEANPLRGRQT